METIDYDKIRIRIAGIVSIGFIIILWIIKGFETYSQTELFKYGVFPREASGLIGILTSPLLHSDYSHLVSNSVPLLVLTFSLFYIYLKSAVKVFVLSYLVPGVTVWLFGREAFHIGASGLVYGLASYIFFMGLFRKDKSSIGLSLVVVFLYGSLVWGVLPTDPAISYESHISGAVIGLLCAVLFRKSEPVKVYDWEKEEETEDDTEYIAEDEEDVYIEDDADEVGFNEDEYYDEELERIKKGKKKRKK